MMFEHEIEARLAHAGATLLALPATGTRPAGFRCGMPPIVREYPQPYGWEPASMRPPIPSPSDIDAMDEALGWLGLIPRDRYVLRRIVAARCLVAPLTGRHLHSWRQLGRVLGADHRAVQRWHADGIRCIARALAQGAVQAARCGHSQRKMSKARNRIVPASPRTVAEMTVSSPSDSTSRATAGSTLTASRQAVARSANIRPSASRVTCSPSLISK